MQHEPSQRLPCAKGSNGVLHMSKCHLHLLGGGDSAVCLFQAEGHTFPVLFKSYCLGFSRNSSNNNNLLHLYSAFLGICHGNWQFYSHQSRDKSTLSLLKGLFSAEKVKSHTDTHKFLQSATKGEGASLPYIHTLKVTGLQWCTVLFLTWHTRKSFALHTHKISIKWIFLNTLKALYIVRGISPHPPPMCSIHLNDVTAAIVGQNVHHTPAYWWRGDRVMKPISVWGWLS